MTARRDTASQPPGRFAAIDFETADYGRDSACALAVVVAEGLRVVDQAHFLIRPPRREFVFSYLHGITWAHVAGQPTFREVWPEALKRLEGVEFIAAHAAAFDRSVLFECCRAGGLAPPAVTFHCTVRLAREVWGIRPTKLPDVCRYLGIPLQHHRADSDALACANIVIAARRQGRAVSTPLARYGGWVTRPGPGRVKVEAPARPRRRPRNSPALAPEATRRAAPQAAGQIVSIFLEVPGKGSYTRTPQDFR
jgi:DNA polymerase-3 subunit epsilon